MSHKCTINLINSLEKEFPRLLELASAYAGEDPTNFFMLLESELQKAFSHYLQFEELLQQLPLSQFNIFKEKIITEGQKDELRGYFKIKSAYNELLGYEYFYKTNKNDEINFVETSTIRTHDLSAYSNKSLKAVMEVKTINISDMLELEMQNNQRPHRTMWFKVETKIPKGLKNKIKKSIQDAIDQLDSYKQNNKIKKIVFLCLNLDYSIGLDEGIWVELINYIKEINKNEYPEFEIIVHSQGIGDYPNKDRDKRNYIHFK